MKVHLINKYKDEWKEVLSKIDHLENAFYFDVIDNWKAHWNAEQKDFAQVYEMSLQSDVSARLWGGNVNSPKTALLQLINTEEEFMRACFRDLFKEDLDLGLRLDRFGFHADQILRPIQSKNPKIVSHFHHDRTILCLYLALEYPEQYCLFDYASFFSMMTKIESRNIPQDVEVERYYKSCRGIFKLIMKDEELVALLESLLHREDLQLMVLSLFMEFVSTRS